MKKFVLEEVSGDTLFDLKGDDKGAMVTVAGVTEAVIVKLEDEKLTVYYRDTKRDISAYILRGGEFNKIIYEG